MQLIENWPSKIKWLWGHSETQSFGEVLQVLLLTHIPILLRLHHDGPFDDVSSLASRLIIADHFQFYPSLFGNQLLLFQAGRSGSFGPHFNKIADILPNEVFVFRHVDRVEIVRLCGNNVALIHDLLLLLINVFEIFWLVPDFKAFLVGIEVEMFLLEVIEEGIGWPSERVQKGIKLLFGSAVVDGVLELLLFLLNHISKKY